MRAAILSVMPAAAAAATRRGHLISKYHGASRSPTAPLLLPLPPRQRRLRPPIEPGQHQNRQQRPLRREVGIDRPVPFVERVPVAALAATADGHGGGTPPRPKSNRRGKPPRSEGPHTTGPKGPTLSVWNAPAGVPPPQARNAEAPPEPPPTP